MVLKRSAYRLINDVLLRPFGLKISFRIGGNPFEDMVSLLRGTPVTTVVDGGACEGTFSRTMATVFPGASIYAFEPTPETFNLLENNTRSLAAVSPQQLALGAKRGTARFYKNASPLTNSLKRNTDANRAYFSGLVDERGQITVDVIALADFAREQKLENLDIIKLDLQGGELDAIVGLGSLIGSVKIVFVEVQFLALYSEAPLFSDVDTHLREVGFALYQFYDLVRSPNDGRLLYGDAMFVRADFLANG